MADPELRSLLGSLRVGDGRTVLGWAVRFDEPSDIESWEGSFTEIFKRGAFSRTLAQRAQKVRFLLGHDMAGLPLGSFTRLEERSQGLWLEGAVAETSAGDDVIALARDGHDLGLSIRFSVPDGGQTWETDKVTRAKTRTITEARLFEVSVVGAPASTGAGVVGVRSVGTPLLSLATARLELLRKRVN